MLLICSSVQQTLMLEDKKPEEGKTQKEFVELCKLRGFFVEDTEELNDLKETRLMAAAAEGRLPVFCQ
jgi:hypothetical protein